MQRIFLSLSIILISSFLFAQQTDKKAIELLQNTAEAMGGWNKLYDLKDVSYIYNYRLVGSDKADVSAERYIFEGEHSYGEYTRHDINVAPGIEGDVIQALVDSRPYVMVGGKVKSDPELVGGAEFIRRANYYWFTMFFKMVNDPGVIATHQGKDNIGGTNYDIVSVTFDADQTGKKANDEYILHLNPKTGLVDRFFFSLPIMGVNSPVILMELDYETIQGMKVATKRRVFQPGENGQLPTEPQMVLTLSKVRFNNGFTPQDLLPK